jgi:hypothetical protein
MRIPTDYCDRNLNTRLKSCPNCAEVVVCVRPAINHWMHFALTLFTSGIWAVVWLIVFLIDRRKPFMCSDCKSLIPTWN